jgi:hypothetical protein
MGAGGYQGRAAVQRILRHSDPKITTQVYSPETRNGTAGNPSHFASDSRGAMTGEAVSAAW